MWETAAILAGYMVWLASKKFQVYDYNFPIGGGTCITCILYYNYILYTCIY